MLGKSMKILEVDKHSLMLSSFLTHVSVVINESRKSNCALKWAFERFSDEGKVMFKLLHVRARITTVPTPMYVVSKGKLSSVRPYTSEADGSTKYESSDTISCTDSDFTYDTSSQTGTYNTMCPDIQFSGSRISIRTSQIDWQSMNSDQVSISGAPTDSSSENQVDISIEIERLRTKLRHARGMYAMAQKETIDASRRRRTTDGADGTGRTSRWQRQAGSGQRRMGSEQKADKGRWRTETRADDEQMKHEITKQSVDNGGSENSTTKWRKKAKRLGGEAVALPRRISRNFHLRYCRRRSVKGQRRRRVQVLSAQKEQRVDEANRNEHKDGLYERRREGLMRQVLDATNRGANECTHSGRLARGCKQKWMHTRGAQGQNRLTGD
ncbi:hypothetical protein Sjap_005180 [Stephania japonica]|uniref:Uncharacterized protein n=1 Tax=Stephania japonica TaxID=461633 RepID=A0AAP0K5V4_9MAGN